MAPLVSIITVVFNGIADIENTIKDVLAQTYPNKEYIIIDGGSTDGTVAVIEKYRNELTAFISEKDSGIYDAMNKAMQWVNGEWVNFMNSGDSFYNHKTIAELFELNNEKYDIIYGNYIANYAKNGQRLIKAALPQAPHQMVLSHQSVFARSQVLRRFPFDTRLRISADLKFYEQCWKQGLKFHYYPQVISVRSHAGLSDINRTLAFRENSMVLEEFYDPKIVKRLMQKLKLMHLIKSGAKKILPSFLQRIYRKNM